MDYLPEGVNLFSLFPQFTTGQVIGLLFALIFIWWVIFTIVAIYHWVRFGRLSIIAVPAVGIHIFVSFYLLFFMIGGFR